MKSKLFLYGCTAAMVLSLAACHDNEEVTLQNGVTIEPAVYSVVTSTTEATETEAAKTTYVPTLTARYILNADDYATPTSAGFVYTTDPAKDPSLLDNVIEGTTFEKDRHTNRRRP